MKPSNWIKLGAEVFTKMGLSEAEAMEHSWKVWQKFIIEDVDPKEELMLKAGICPQCKQGGYLMPVDNDLIDYKCLNCGGVWFIIEEEMPSEISTLEEGQE